MNLTTQGLPYKINGDLIVGYTNSQKLEHMGWEDLSTLASWYKKDPSKRHLGLINLYNQMGATTTPMYKNFFKEKAVLEVDGVGDSFTYDIAVTKGRSGTYTTVDTSGYSATPGIDGTLFPITTDKPFRPGDTIGYDGQNGSQAIVSEDKTITQDGDSWTHWCTLVDNDRGAWFPTEFLKAGVEYAKIGHNLGEYSVDYSGITHSGDVQTIKLEFVLGNHRGVETAYTMYSNKKMAHATVNSQTFMSGWLAELEKCAVDENGKKLDMFYFGAVDAGGNIDMGTVRVGTILEKLVALELMKIESHQLMFQKGAIINDIHGTKRLNEGIWHQFKRGRVLNYTRPGGINFTHIRQMMAYLYRFRPNVTVDERHIKLKAGKMAYDNITALIQREAIQQAQAISSLMGTESLLPKSPIQGNSLTELSVQPIKFNKALIPGVGWVEVEHEPALDYQPLVDRRARGFFGSEGYPDSSYSVIVEDAMEVTYADVNKVIRGGAQVMQGGNTKANIYYVKPEGEGFHMGYSEGRWSPDKVRNIPSSMKQMAREFWAHSVSAGWVKDPSRFIILELKR